MQELSRHYTVYAPPVHQIKVFFSIITFLAHFAGLSPPKLFAECLVHDDEEEVEN